MSTDILTASTVPMSYDIDTGQFTFYSEDFDLIGEHDFTIAAHLSNYPSIGTAA